MKIIDKPHCEITSKREFIELRSIPIAILIIIVIAKLMTSCTDIKSKNNSIMESNKQKIEALYQSLNNRNFVALEELVSEKYVDAQGNHGVQGFKNQIQEFINSFPDAVWTVNKKLAEGHSVFIEQEVSGTHLGSFQGIAPTGNIIKNLGMIIYEFENGKVISSSVLTDRLGFQQQLQDKTQAVCFVDKFTIPLGSEAEFTRQMNYNREFVSKLPGYIDGSAMRRISKNNKLEIVTLAYWKDKKSIDEAKEHVQAHFKKINFNPQEFYKKLDVEMERVLYTSIIE